LLSEAQAYQNGEAGQLNFLSHIYLVFITAGPAPHLKKRIVRAADDKAKKAAPLLGPQFKEADRKGIRKGEC
jgi:hypothetical protein